MTRLLCLVYIIILYNYILIYEKGKSRDAPALAIYML